MLKRWSTGLMVCAVLAGAPAVARAQQQSSLTGLMLDQFTQNIVLAKTPSGNGIAAHTPVFTTSADVVAVQNLVQQVSQQIGAQVSNVALGSSSGGFTYRYDAARGTFTPSTDTFGPAFAERAATIGRKQFNFGMTFQHSSYSSLDGRSLSNGDLKFFLPHQELEPESFVEGDMIEAQVNLKLSSDSSVFFVNYGLADALDVSIVIPVNHVSMNLTYHATILDFATHAVSPGTHVFANGSKAEDISSTGSATGIGDILLRAKYNLAGRGAQGFAVGLDLSLPSGDASNMLGSGGTQAKFYLIGSSAAGKLASHVNVGYTVGAGGVSDQFNYVGGEEFRLSPKVTVVGDLVGRTFRSGLRIVDTPSIHTFQQGDQAPVESALLPAIGTSPGDLTSVQAAIGAKFNPTRTLLISAHVVITLTNAGLKRNLSPVLGFDYSF
jgi:hypothetical protein